MAKKIKNKKVEFSGKKKIIKLLNRIQEYWYVNAILITAVCSIVYMFVFRVSPWDSYIIEKQKHKLVKLNNNIGFCLLEKGHYKPAKKQFEKSVQIEKTNPKTMMGLELSNLFIELESPTWDPAIGIATQNNLENFRSKKLNYIVEKYLADLNYGIGNLKKAKTHYEKALELNETYVDALLAYGWFNYSAQFNLAEMTKLFERLVAIDSFDYRGYHGYGYALYINSINNSSFGHRHKILIFNT